jgi:dTDP-glucose pyrophosphorylase
MIGIIPAAGRGTRVYPYSTGIPKAMLDVAGRPNIEGTIEILRDQMLVERIVIVVGAQGSVIRDYFGDGSRMGIPIRYVQNNDVELGLGHSLLLARPFVDDHCVVMLSDECYVGTNHATMLATDFRNTIATCAVKQTDATELIERNYAVFGASGRVARMVEKPRRTRNAMLGLGTFILSPDFFAHLQDPVSAASDHVASDPVSVLGRLVRNGHRVNFFVLDGIYVNINDRDALNLARIEVRSRRFEAHTVGMALLMKGSLADTSRSLREFLATGLCEQVVLVAPPAEDIPSLPQGVRCVRAPSGQYGDMMRCGLDSLSTDIVMCAHSDGSCRPRDLPKFLAYLKDADLVVGTRTTRQLIEQGANMRGVIRLAHILLAKVLELVWWDHEPRFTDVGCSYRAAWRSTYTLIRDGLHTSGPEYSVEMLLEFLCARRRIIEIPVSFAVRRRGVKEPNQTLPTFIAIAVLILWRRLRAWSAPVGTRASAHLAGSRHLPDAGEPQRYPR